MVSHQSYHIGLFLIALLGLIDVLNGYKYFQERIPNGDRLPHPCKPNYLWHGVGHKNEAGGGVRNPFGLDFARNGYKWDPCLCETDSDGDGKPNGEELGDPLCMWAEGSLPQITDFDRLSHPGICEPLDDPKCVAMNDWEFCSIEEFDCEAFDRPDVEKLTIRFPETNVPSSETTYMCMAFALPSDKDYHIIGMMPEIDNADIMHHAFIYGCEGDIGTQYLETYASPVPCSYMIQQSCPAILATWTLGTQGNCPDESFGFPMGATGYTVAVVEFHWNNPQMREDYTDSSGMTLVYTPNLRENDGNTLFVGAVNFEIPPGQNSHEETGYCTSKCTSTALDNNIYITEFAPHMHYLGRSMVVEHWRDGSKQLQIDVPTYNYDSPQFTYYDPPIEFRPGDEIKVSCEFSSKNRDEITYFGEATSDEMCFAILTYYPSNPSFPYCMFNTRNTTGYCGGFVLENMNCDYTKFFTELYTNIIPLYTACDPSGKTCLPTCEAAIDDLMSTSDCFGPDMIHVTKSIMYQQESMRPVILMMNSCSDIVVPDASSSSVGGYHDVEGSLCINPIPSSATTAVMFVYLGFIFAIVMLLV